MIRCDSIENQCLKNTEYNLGFDETE